VPRDDSDRAARLLLKALDSLSDRDRRFVMRALLLGRIAAGARSPSASREVLVGSMDPASPIDLPRQVMDPGFQIQSSRQVDQPLLVRLPSDLHARFRRWATAHGFSMAGIVRGLVERFLDEQEGKRPRTRA
jgi:hypothetical protein